MRGKSVSEYKRGKERASEDRPIVTHIYSFVLTCTGGSHPAAGQQPAERARRRHAARQPRAQRRRRRQQGVREGVP